MVVVSGTWVKNVAAFPTPAINDMVIQSENKMTAKAVLICRPSSHPFQDRTLCLELPIKVGRSVARTRATSTNAIFDCKVLSRNHALLWYENGKFYLQDTKSSNGTFVNNNKLSADDEHHEVYSGDIVQFGVDVIENNRKVTHGCIVATLKLYLPDGKEAKASPSVTGNRHEMVSLDELYKLNRIIQEAFQREESLEIKLLSLQVVIERAKKSADGSWAAYLAEERLLSRIATLEAKLSQATKNWTEERYKEEYSKLQEEHNTYQTAAKEALEKLHAERLAALDSATKNERAKQTAEQESVQAKEQLAKAQYDVEVVLKKLSEVQKKSEEERIELEEKYRELKEKLDNVEFKAQLDKLPNEKSELEKLSIICSNDDVKTKEEFLAKNDENNVEVLKNGDDYQNQNHITLNVAPVNETPSSDGETSPSESSSVTSVVNNFTEDQVTFRDFHDKENENGDTREDEKNEDNEFEKRDDDESDHIDSKTLKYQFQSTQNELKRRIETLEDVITRNQSLINELQQQLGDERRWHREKVEENSRLKDETTELNQKLKESSNETQRLWDKVTALSEQLQATNAVSQQKPEAGDPGREVEVKTTSGVVSYEQLIALEEELVHLKERFAQANDEKLQLQHNLGDLKDKYNKMCNSSHNTLFIYIAPLVLIVIYLLIREMFS